VGGVSILSQLTGTVMAAVWALLISTMVYSFLKATIGIRLDSNEELQGADLTIHRIGAYPEQRIR
jgi:Amt family ammonium transporter